MVVPDNNQINNLPVPGVWNIWRRLKSHTSPEYFDYKTFRLYRHCQSSQRLCELEELTNPANSLTFLLEYSANISFLRLECKFS
jgi:hypothetical protein